MLAVIFIVIVSVSLIALTFKVVVMYKNFADESQSSFTKAIKVCTDNQCFVQDFTVFCKQGNVIRIEAIGRAIAVPIGYNKTGISGWCD